jgi:hypothetical protein
MRCLLPLLLTSCVAALEQRCRDDLTPSGLETPYDVRMLCANAYDMAARKARYARKNGERWCQNRGDGMQVCRSPVPEDFYVQPMTMAK